MLINTMPSGDIVHLTSKDLKLIENSLKTERGILNPLDERREQITNLLEAIHLKRKERYLALRFR